MWRSLSKPFAVGALIGGSIFFSHRMNMFNIVDSLNESILKQHPNYSERQIIQQETEVLELEDHFFPNDAEHRPIEESLREIQDVM